MFSRSLLAFAMIILSAVTAAAQDKLMLALGQRGNWDTAIAPLGEQAGIFKKHGLMLDVLWTQGAGESQQAVLSGSVDIGLAGTIAALAAFAKGAPVRIIAAEATGGADYWYVRADLPHQEPGRYRRQDHRLFHQWCLDPHARACVHGQERRRRKLGRNRRSGANLHAGHVGSD